MDRQELHDRIGGMAAWWSGQGPQWSVAQQRDEELAILRDSQRREALLRDFYTGYQMIQNGRVDQATQLFGNRLDMLKKLNAPNIADTQAVYDRLASGDPAKIQEAADELGAFIQTGMAMGEFGGAAGGSPQQFGASFIVKDEAGNMFQGTQVRDPNTGQVQTALSPIGHNSPQQGSVSMVGQMGMTPGESINYAGQKTGAQQDAIANRAAIIEELRATGQLRGEMGASGGPSKADIAGDVQLAKDTAAAQVERGTTQRQSATAYETYKQGMAGVAAAFKKADTGPVAGRLPAVTVAAQGAEGARAAMAPVLKQLFRVSGEGVFTDKDQQLLLDMMPDRKDHPEVVQQKMGTIDAIVKAKLNMGGDGTAPSAAKTIVRRGFDQATGKRVVLYSDGSMGTE